MSRRMPPALVKTKAGSAGDQIINPDLERWYYERAGASYTVIEGASHSVYVSHPEQVAAITTDAARKAMSSNSARGE